jgi:hypothetical protein
MSKRLRREFQVHERLLKVAARSQWFEDGIGADLGQIKTSKLLAPIAT